MPTSNITISKALARDLRRAGIKTVRGAGRTTIGETMKDVSAQHRRELRKYFETDFLTRLQRLAMRIDQLVAFSRK